MSKKKIYNAGLWINSVLCGLAHIYVDGVLGIPFAPAIITVLFGGLSILLTKQFQKAAYAEIEGISPVEYDRLRRAENDPALNEEPYSPQVEEIIQDYQRYKKLSTQLMYVYIVIWSLGSWFVGG